MGHIRIIRASVTRSPLHSLAEGNKRETSYFMTNNQVNYVLITYIHFKPWVLQCCPPGSLDMIPSLPPLLTLPSSVDWNRFLSGSPHQALSMAARMTFLRHTVIFCGLPNTCMIDCSETLCNLGPTCLSYFNICHVLDSCDNPLASLHLFCSHTTLGINFLTYFLHYN